MISIRPTAPAAATIPAARWPSPEKKKSPESGRWRATPSIYVDRAVRRRLGAPPPIPCSHGAHRGGADALLSLRALRGLLLVLSGFVLQLLLPFSADATSAAENAPRREKRKAKGKGEVIGARSVRDWEAKARRGMAIRRLGRVEEEERSKREFAGFSTERGYTLFTQSWTPLIVPTKGLVVLLHGLNEHSGRYNHFARQLNDEGLKVYAMDWIGHGGSDGLHGYVQSLDYAVDDLKSFLKKVLEDNPSLPCFLFGHSTGGAIVLKAVLDPKIEVCVEGVVLTSPAIRVQPSHPIIPVVAPIFSMLVPKYQFRASRRHGPPVSRDPEALKVKYSDPLVFTGPIRVRTGNEVLRISSYLQQNLTRVTIPFLVLHGTADTVTDPQASQRLYEESSSTDKTLQLYDGLLHDLLFEPEKDDIAKDITDWFRPRIQQRMKGD